MNQTQNNKLIGALCILFFFPFVINAQTPGKVTLTQYKEQKKLVLPSMVSPLLNLFTPIPWKSPSYIPFMRRMAR